MESDDLLAVKKRKVEIGEALKEIQTKNTDSLENVQVVKKRKLENPNRMDNEEYCAITKPEENSPVASSKYSLQNCTTNALSQIDSLLDKINDQQTDATKDSRAYTNQDMTDTVMIETLEEEDKNKNSGMDALLVSDGLSDKIYDQKKDATKETHVNINQKLTNKTMIEETAKKEDTNKNIEIHALSVMGNILNTIYDEQKDTTTDSLISKNQDIIAKVMIKKTVEKEEKNKNCDIKSLSIINSLLDEIDQQKDAAEESQVNKNQNITGKTMEETVEKEDTNKIIANDFPVEHNSNATQTSTDIINLDSSDDEEIMEKTSPVLTIKQSFQNTTEVKTISALPNDIIDLTNNSFNDEQSNESFPESYICYNLSVKEDPPVGNMITIDLTDCEEENNELVSKEGSQSVNSDGKHNSTQKSIPVNTNIIKPRKDQKKSVNIKLYKSSSSKNTWLMSRQSNEDIQTLQISSDSSSSIGDNVDNNSESENNDDSEMSLQDTDEKDAEADTKSDVTDSDNDNENETNSQSGTMDSNVNDDTEFENNANGSSKSFGDSDSNSSMDIDISDEVDSQHSDNNIEDSSGSEICILPNDDLNNYECDDIEDSDLDSVIRETRNELRNAKHYDSSDDDDESTFDEDLDVDSSPDDGSQGSFDRKFVLNTNSSDSFESSSDEDSDSDGLLKEDEKKTNENLKLCKEMCNSSDDSSDSVKELSSEEEFDALNCIQVDSDSENTTDINVNDGMESQNNGDKIEILHKDTAEPDSELKTDDELIETSQTNTQSTLKNNLSDGTRTDTNYDQHKEDFPEESKPVYDVQCSLTNCITKIYDENNYVPTCYFRFPSDFVRCSAWIEQCGSRNLPIINLQTLHRCCLYLCSLHFEKEMFLSYENKVLCDNALPTIFRSNTTQPKKSSTIHTKITKIKMIFDLSIKAINNSLCSSTSSPTGFPEDIQFQKLVSEAISQNEDVNKSVILLQERFKNVDTIEKCIQMCEELLPPDFLKLVKDYLLDN